MLLLECAVPGAQCLKSCFFLVLQRQQVDRLTNEKDSAQAELKRETEERMLQQQAHANDVKQLQARLDVEVRLGSHLDTPF